MTKHVRINYKNAIRETGVTASAAAAGYPASNVLTLDKAETWRSTGKTGVLSGSSATLRTAGIAFALGNFSPTCTMRVILWADVAKTVYVLDTGPVLACPEPSAEIADWTPAQAASAYAHGGGAKARVWFDPTIQFRAWEIQFDDTVGNLQSALEVVFAVLGSYFSPTYDVEGGIPLTLHDESTKTRSAAGSVKVRKGIRYDTMPFDLTGLTANDKREVLRIFRYCGTTEPILVALNPEHADAEYEAATMIYGTLDEVAELTLDGPDSFATSIPIQSL